MAIGDGNDDAAREPAENDAARRPVEGDTAIMPGDAAEAPPPDPYDEANAPEGALVDAPAEPLPEVVEPPAKPPVLRRKRRDLDRRRQRALLDLGGLVVEMARRERMRIDLLKHRAAIVLAFDAEIDAIDEALQARRTRARPARAAAAAAEPCPNCGSPVPPGANYCPSCGASVLTDAPAEAAADGAEPAPATPAEP